jgi:biotin carboxyl carrier protein
MASEIKAEVSANVWKVVVNVGAQVQEGDTIVILESNKMEIPVVADIDGIIGTIAVAEGAPVQEGDLIAVID